MELTARSQAQMVAALRRRLRAAGPVQLFETHVSFVLVTAHDAFKLKKALDLGFVDASTLARRARLCRLELACNRARAPTIYRDVVAIHGTPTEPAIGGSGPVIDHAVRMRAFDQGARWDRMLARHRLRPEHVQALGTRLALAHADAAVTREMRFGSPDSLWRQWRDCLGQLLRLLPGQADRERLEALRSWAQSAMPRLAEAFEHRRRGGFIRELHGDLHLANIAMVDDMPLMFDAIEFDPALSRIDVIADLAFTLMDLEHHGRSDLSAVLLDAYLQENGDFAALKVLRWYLVHRALVRALVAALRARQSQQPQASAVAGGDRSSASAVHEVDALAQCAGLLDTALRLANPSGPLLIITHGYAGSGKTTAAAKLVQALPAVQIRSDVERKRMAGLPILARSASRVGEGLYTRSMGAAVYQRLFEAAAAALVGGFHVVLDAAFLQRADRDQARAVACRAGARFLLLDCVAAPAHLRRRLILRRRGRHDASEAGLRVLAEQRQSAQVLGADERSLALRWPHGVAAASACAQTMAFMLHVLPVAAFPPTPAGPPRRDSPVRSRPGRNAPAPVG